MHHHRFFTIRLRRFTQIGFFALCVFFAFSMAAVANDKCPKIDSHETAAIKYQLFSAYQTGFDGYEAPCEIKCFGNSNCQNRCQSNKAMEFLAKQMQQLKDKKGVESCPSFTLACLDQCQALGPQCAQVCDGSAQVGSANADNL